MIFVLTLVRRKMASRPRSRLFFVRFSLSLTSMRAVEHRCAAFCLGGGFRPELCLNHRLNLLVCERVCAGSFAKKRWTTILRLPVARWRGAAMIERRLRAKPRPG